MLAPPPDWQCSYFPDVWFGVSLTPCCIQHDVSRLATADSIALGQCVLRTFADAGLAVPGAVIAVLMAIGTAAWCGWRYGFWGTVPYQQSAFSTAPARRLFLVQETDMELSPAGAAFVRHHEGFVSRYYRDPVGIGTIGIGFTWASSSFRAWWAKNRPGQTFGPGARMTREEAQDALIYLMREEYGAAVNRFFDAPVAQSVFDGASSVVFNAGAGTLSDRWAQALKKGDLHDAAELLKTTRVTAKGRRLAGLVSRRLDEAELIELGDYTIGRPKMDAMADGMLVRGESGEDVRRLQADLKTAGFYDDGVTDGIFGPGTESAVMAFQRSRGLADDGYAGPQTLAAIKAARVPAPTSRPAPEPTMPAEQTSAPAPIGRNGGPAMTPDLSPVEATNKANKGSVAAVGGGGVGGAILYLWSLTGSFPAEWSTDPQAMIALTVIVSAISAGVTGWIGAYKARDYRVTPKNAG